MDPYDARLPIPVATGPVLVEKTFVKEGINVEFSLQLVRADKRGRTAVHDGDDVLFRFKMTDKNGRSPHARSTRPLGST